MPIEAIQVHQPIILVQPVPVWVEELLRAVESIERMQARKINELVVEVNSLRVAVTALENA